MIRPSCRWTFLVAGFALLVCSLPFNLQAQNIDLDFRDRDSDTNVFARLKFTKGEKQAGLPRTLLKSGSWFLAEQSFSIAPKAGEYEFVVHRGHEFTDIRGGFTIEKGARDIVLIEIPRSTNMSEEGWYSGDHQASLPIDRLTRWQKADAVDMAVSLWESNPSELLSPEGNGSKQTSRRSSQTKNNTDQPGTSEIGLGLSTISRRWQNDGGSLLLHPTVEGEAGLRVEDISLPEIMETLADWESTKRFVPELEYLWSREVPILLSSNRIRAAQVLNTTNLPNGDIKLDLGANPKSSGPFKLRGSQGKQDSWKGVFAPINEDDLIRYRDGRGIGLLSEQILWKILDTGIRITPTGATGFGSGETHLGYNRTYVHSEAELDREQYWQGVSLGRTMVTNGPLLRVTVNQQYPGSTFTSRAGEPIELDISAALSVRDPVDYLDVVFNGETLYSAKLEDHFRRGEFPPISIEQSGWLVVRVVTSHDHVYRYASTAPFYFEFDGKTRVSKKSVEFMNLWLDRAVQDIQRGKNLDSTMESVLESAKSFWRERLEQANAP
ncbi:hypothetical protein SH449x_002091 [Pirellulaceae bacterium SH449]